MVTGVYMFDAHGVHEQVVCAHYAHWLETRGGEPVGEGEVRVDDLEPAR